MNKKIFIACPISKYLLENSLEKQYEKFIKSIYSLCNEYSDNVFLALYREEFGQARMEDDVCTPLDYIEMKDADIVIAIPEDSQGVAVELGWASAMKKKIFLVLNKKERNSPLINALHTVADTEYHITSFEDNYPIKEVKDAISDYLDKCFDKVCIHSN